MAYVLNNDIDTCCICLHKDPTIDISENIYHIPCTCNIYCHISCFNGLEDKNKCFICKRRFTVDWGDIPIINDNIPITNDISIDILNDNIDTDIVYEDNDIVYEDNDSYIDKCYNCIYNCCINIDNCCINIDNMIYDIHQRIEYICYLSGECFIFLAFIIYGLLLLSLFLIILYIALMIGGFFFNLLICMNSKNIDCMLNAENPMLILYGIIGLPLLSCIFTIIYKCFCPNLNRIHDEWLDF